MMGQVAAAFYGVERRRDPKRCARSREKVRDVRVRRERPDSFLSDRTMYSAAMRNSSRGGGTMPRRRRTGFLARPARLSREKFCMFSAPIWTTALAYCSTRSSDSIIDGFGDDACSRGLREPSRESLNRARPILERNRGKCAACRAPQRKSLQPVLATCSARWPRIGLRFRRRRGRRRARCLDRRSRTSPRGVGMRRDGVFGFGVATHQLVGFADRDALDHTGQRFEDAEIDCAVIAGDPDGCASSSRDRMGLEAEAF